MPPPGMAGVDDRMYLDKESNAWRFEADDGTEMEYDASKAAWIPVVRPIATIYLATVANSFVDS
jgi:hypothetical protein